MSTLKKYFKRLTIVLTLILLYLFLLNIYEIVILDKIGNSQVLFFVNKVVRITYLPIFLTPKYAIGPIYVKKSVFIKGDKTKTIRKYSFLKKMEFKDYETIGKLKYHIDLNKGNVNSYFILEDDDNIITSNKNVDYCWSQNYFCFEKVDNQLVIYNKVTDKIKIINMKDVNNFILEIIDRIIIIYTNKRTLIYNLESAEKVFEIESRIAKYEGVNKKIAFHDKKYIYQYDIKTNNIEKILKESNLSEGYLFLIYNNRGILHCLNNNKLYKINFKKLKIVSIKSLPGTEEILSLNNNIYILDKNKLFIVQKNKKELILNDIDFHFYFKGNNYFVIKGKIFKLENDNISQIFNSKYEIRTQFLWDLFGNYKVLYLDNNEFYILFEGGIFKL